MALNSASESRNRNDTTSNGSPSYCWVLGLGPHALSFQRDLIGGGQPRRPRCDLGRRSPV